MTEYTTVVIVGGGPSGLALGLSLANHKVKSIILEKELEITQDPRGVALQGDSVRVLWGLGIQDELKFIGHELSRIMFHRGSMVHPPFLEMDTDKDWRHQSIPDAIMQVQPELERAMEQKLEASGFCQLRRDCEVIAIEETIDKMLVQYRSRDGLVKRLEGMWLVGADGKKGYVRKNYLEPKAGVRQEPGLFAYEGTWIAANLRIKLPTPESHPGLPFWQTGMSPEEVYDLFWPKHVHFISPPGRPTASMRFGPENGRLWRHEFAEPHWEASQNPEDLLWNHLLPMVTREEDGRGHKFESTTFPKDCIELLRCGPYTFAQKVVNKWFYSRTILIGDAAHVFPPFGGQGITSGIRDAQALAWRLAILANLPELQQSVKEGILATWSQERKQGIDDSARFTKSNGDLVNEEEKWIPALVRNFFQAVRKLLMMPPIVPENERAEERAYKPVKNGFFLPDHNGGGKVAQIYLQRNEERPLLSDQLLSHEKSLMTLVILEDKGLSEVEDLLAKLDLPEIVISKESLVQISGAEMSFQSPNSFRACNLADLEEEMIRNGYDSRAYSHRLGKGTKFAIIRPDFIVHSTAKSILELEQCLLGLKRCLG